MTIAPVPQVGHFQSCMELLGSPTTYLLTENNLVSHSDDRLSCLFKPCDWEQLRLHACADNISRCLSSSFPVSDLCPASISPAAAADFHQLWFYAEDIFIRVLFKGCSYPCAGVCVGKYDHVHCHRHTRSTWSFSVVILMEQIYQKSEIAKWMKHKQNFIH